MASKGKKPVADSFSSSQPGYISVAGESFFLNLPDDKVDTIESRLTDDSLKGDLAFQGLFLGGKSKEQDPNAPFTKQEQIDLRRIFRAIFGVNSVPGKKGIALPCRKADLNLMLKALEIRRKTLIGQIQAYDTLASPDVHARYLREHLVRLNKLIGDEIPNSFATCKDTSILDPNAPPRLPLDDPRMLRLLEIFAFLLAQGADPLAAFSDKKPSPNDIIPRMAVKDAPGLRDYEEAYASEHPGKAPEYTDTLLKLKKLLQGEGALDQAVADKQLQQAFEEIEKALQITAPTGSFGDRAKNIIKKIEQYEAEKRSDLEELSKARTALAAKQTELDTALLDAKKCKEELDALKEAKAKLEAECKENEGLLAAAKAAMDDLGKELEEMEAKLAASEGRAKAAEDAKAAAEAALKAAQEAKDAAEQALKAATDAKAAADAALEAATKELADLRAQLDAATAEKAALQAEKDALDQQLKDVNERIAALQGQLEKATARIAELETDKARLDALLAVEPNLTPEMLQQLLGKQAEIDELRRQLEACPKQEEIDALRARIAELEQRPTPEQLEELRQQVQKLQTDAEAVQPLLDKLRQLEGILGDELTPERLAELMRAEEKIAGLEARIRELEQRPNITQADYEDLEGRLQKANTRLAELEGRGDISEEDLQQLRDDFEEASGEVENLKEEKEALQASLADANETVQKLQDEAAELNRKLQAAQGSMAEQLKQALAERDAAKADAEQLRGMLETTKGTIAALQRQVDTIPELNQMIDQLQAAIDDDIAKFKEFDEQIGKLKAEADKVPGLLAQVALIPELEKKVATIPGLQQELDKFKAEAAKIPGLTEQIATFQAQVAQIPELQTKIKDLTDKAAAELEQKTALQQQLAAAQARAESLQKELDERPTKEALAAVVQERDTLKAEVESTKIYKILYTKLNEMLQRKGLAPIEASPSEDQITQHLQDLEGRIGKGDGGSSRPNLCLLHLMYSLLRKLVSRQGITVGEATIPAEQFQAMFEHIESKARSKPIPETILTMFFEVLKKLMTEGVPIRGELEVYPPAGRAAFLPIYTKADELLGAAPMFLNEDKQAASELLNQFFSQRYSFVNYLLSPNGTIKQRDGSPEEGIVNIGSLFLLVLTATQQILSQAEGLLKEIGCFIPAPVAPAPRPIPAPVPRPDPVPGPLPPAPVPGPPAIDVRLSEVDRCKPGLVPGTRFTRVPMPSLNDLPKMTKQDEQLLYKYLLTIRDAKPPISPLCEMSIGSRLSEKRVYEKFEQKYGSHPAFHVSTGPAPHERQRIDPASIPARAGIRSGVFGGTRRKPKMRKARKTKKIRKT